MFNAKRSGLYWIPFDDRGDDGAALVEVAISIWLFFMLTVSLAILIWAAWTALTLNFAVAKTARWGALGETLVDPHTMEPLDRLDSFVLRFETEAKRFGLDPRDVTLRICPVSNSDCTSNTLGSPGSMIVIRAEKPPVELLGRHLALRPSCSVMLLNET